MSDAKHWYQNAESEGGQFFMDSFRIQYWADVVLLLNTFDRIGDSSKVESAGIVDGLEAEEQLLWLLMPNEGTDTIFDGKGEPASQSSPGTVLVCVDKASGRVHGLKVGFSVYVADGGLGTEAALAADQTDDDAQEGVEMQSMQGNPVPEFDEQDELQCTAELDGILPAGT